MDRQKKTKEKDPPSKSKKIMNNTPQFPRKRNQHDRNNNLDNEGIEPHPPTQEKETTNTLSTTISLSPSPKDTKQP